MGKKVRLLNVDFDDLTLDEFVETFRVGMPLTVHVDMIMKLQKDPEFYALLQNFSPITCDSQVLVAAARLLGTPLKGRVSGSDFFPRFYMKHKDDPEVTIFLCGGAPGVAEVAAEKINQKVGRSMVVGTASPSPHFDRSPAEIDQIVEAINRSGASVLLVALGAGRQEKFMVNNRARLPRVKTFLALGGTVDYEAGTLPRPAPWVTNVGLEWLYRLTREPRKRWRRYLVHQPPVVWHLAKQWLGLYKNPFSAG